MVRIIFTIRGSPFNRLVTGPAGCVAGGRVRVHDGGCPGVGSADFPASEGPDGGARVSVPSCVAAAWAPLHARLQYDCVPPPSPLYLIRSLPWNPALPRCVQLVNGEVVQELSKATDSIIVQSTIGQKYKLVQNGTI